MPGINQIPDDSIPFLEWWYNGQPYENAKLSEFNQHQFLLLARLVVRIYGKTITCDALRYAVIATSKAIISGDIPMEIQNMVFRELRKKDESKWEGGELLAIALLAFSVPRERSFLWQWEIHANGFYRAMEKLSCSHSGNILRECWLMARDLVIGFRRWELEDSVFFRHGLNWTRFMHGYRFLPRWMLASDRLQGLCWDLDLHIEVIARAMRARIRQGNDPNVTEWVWHVKYDVYRIHLAGMGIVTNSWKFGLRYWMLRLFIRIFGTYDIYQGFPEDAVIDEIQPILGFLEKGVESGVESNYPVRSAVALLILSLAGKRLRDQWIYGK
jgi:hypothetical protein